MKEDLEWPDKRFMSKLVKASQNIKLEREKERQEQTTPGGNKTSEVIPRLSLTRLSSLVRYFIMQHPSSS